MQQKITGFMEGRMLAVRKVYENGLATEFVPSSWNRASYRMSMALGLNSRIYKSMPKKELCCKMLSLGKIRRFGISSFRDKAMQSLWYYALEPIEE